jgi:dextranase
MKQVIPDKAFYHPHEPVTLQLQGKYEATIWHLSDLVAEVEGSDQFQWTPPPDTKRGYRLRIETVNQTHWTAFDVLNHWTDNPRYGYLFDFSPQRKNYDFSWLLAHHVNGLQFYDWQYRHDTLLPPSREYDDPLQRRLSLDSVERLIDVAHRHNIAAMPYTAIYAASPEFAQDHLAWGFYDVDGLLIDFADGFLKIMNLDSPWQGHFIDECRRLLDAMPFDGIHVDQYGDPRIGFDAEGRPVNLPQAFEETLQNLRQGLGKHTLLFNLVHNFPIEVMDASLVDFIYCELWEPQTTLGDLARVAKLNRKVASNKPPVIAAYINPQFEETIKLAQCVITASGAYHIAHGESDLFLCDPYFPKAQPLSAELAEYLKRIADFQVAYGELLVFAEPTLIAVTVEDGIWVIGHRWGSGFVINLVNANPNQGWDQALDKPQPKNDIPLKIEISADVAHVWTASPDAESPPQKLDFRMSVDGLHLTVPQLDYWCLICIETSNTGTNT